MSCLFGGIPCSDYREFYFPISGIFILQYTDKGACISFRGQKYETRPMLIGYDVEIAYDPMSPDTITVHHPGIAPFTARPVKIGAFCDKLPVLPLSMQASEPETSRFLAALEKKHVQSKKQTADAISFASFGKGGSTDV